MTPPRVPVSDLASGERLLRGAVGHYVARVLRLRAGDAFVAFDPASAHEADAVTVRAEGQDVEVCFGSLREGGSRAARSITWIQGLAKGDKCDAVARDITELGATRYIVSVTVRSVVRLDVERGRARKARWARIVLEAARQSGRSDVPRVDAPMAWADALAEVGSQGARFCLWERAEEPLGPPLFEALSRPGPLAFACGPEGGLEDDEAGLARANGWTLVSLGPRTLRTETVAAAVLGAVAVGQGLFGS